MTVTIDPAAYAAWIAARAEYDATMREGPASKTPYVQMRTEQINAAERLALAAMRVAMGMERQ